MPIAAIIPAIAAAVGGALANRKKTSTSTSTASSTSMPATPEAYQPLEQSLIDMSMKRLQGSTNLGGYEANALRDINATGKLQEQTLENRLTSMGLGTSPIAGHAYATMEAGRGQSIAQLKGSLPLLQRAMQDQDFQNALALFGKSRGQTMTGTTSGETTQPGNMAGGAFSSAASMLGWLYGQGKLGGQG